jgi:hypothetical protein
MGGLWICEELSLICISGSFADRYMFEKVSERSNSTLPFDGVTDLAN